MAKKSRVVKVKRLTDEQMWKIIADAWGDFEGNLFHFEGAVGALFVGREVGWQVLRLMHPGAYRKYEKTLKIVFKDVLEPRGRCAGDVRGVQLLDQLLKSGRTFWQVAESGFVSSKDVTHIRQLVI